MPVKSFEITDTDIEYAEKILLKEGHSFDAERREFIKNLQTLDLQAVPGSGKTTALLAKLLILDRYLPFDDGSSILVVSHTNAAVNEIKERIGKHCSKLFAYPNFVGTIQGFVDEFLAIPFYCDKFKSRIVRIDNEIYDEQVERYYNYGMSRDLKSWIKNKKEPLEFLKKIRLDLDKNLIPERNKKATDFELKNKTKPTYKSLFQFKIDLLKKGYLHFDDAYLLAFSYIKSNERIKLVIQKRFKYVFVDEMQDMDIHQYDILEQIFWNNGDTPSVYQRIGDKNQAIFNGEAILDTIWHDRPTVLKLNKSYRLSKNIATIVNNFTLNPIDVIGHQKNEDGSEIDIKPHLFVYTDENSTKIISKYIEIIQSLQNENKILVSDRNKYSAIAWNTTEVEPNKIRMNSYFSPFSREESKPKIDYNCIDSYLCLYDKNSQTLEAIKKNILNALLKVLRLENQLDNEGRNFTARKLLKHLLEKNKDVHKTLELKLFQWSMNIVKKQKDTVLADIRTYNVEFLSVFGKTIKNSADFINGIHTGSHTEASKLDKKNNIFSDGDVEVEIGTIHSVKGQTHTATLYLETFKGRGGGNYESERLANQIKGTVFMKSETGIINQSVKMVYVGFSRPTHLLCFAVHKSRFDKHLHDIDRDIWEVIEIEN